MLDSEKLLEFVNELTLIQNHIANDQMFLAGRNIAYLQTRIVNLYEDVLKEEAIKKTKKD